MERMKGWSPSLKPDPSLIEGLCESSSSTMISKRYRFARLEIRSQDLIQYVKKRPLLWNKRCTEYKDKYARERAWLEIFKEVEPNYDSLSSTAKVELARVVTKKWNNLRDSYRKSRISKGYRSRPYLYSQMMSFLDKSIFHNIGNEDDGADDNEGNKDNDCDDIVSTEKNDLDCYDDSAQEDYIFVDNLDTSHSDSPIKIPNQNPDVLSVLTNILSQENDEDNSFFKSVLPHVQQLSGESRLEFRIQVMTLIKKLKKHDKKLLKLKTEQHVTSSDTE